VRAEASLGLGRVDPLGFTSLVRCLSDPQRGTIEERVALLLALGYTHDPQAIPVLLDLLGAAQVTSAEREAAVHALGLVYADEPSSPTSRLGYGANFVRESPDVVGILYLIP
jgi:HEAT repeat protein